MKKNIRHLLIVSMCLSLPFWITRSSAQTFLTNGLVAFFPLSGNADDASGNGINGTVPSGVTWTTDQLGNPNGALDFGTTGEAVLGTGINLSSSSSSISLWIKKNYVGNLFNGSPFLRVGDVGANGQAMHLATDYGQSIRYSFWNNDFDINSPILLEGVWYNLTVTFDNSTSERSIFVNGCLVATNLASYGFTGSSSFGFGYLNISLDDVRFYNRALPPNEVQQLYAFESGPLIGLIKAVKPVFANLSVNTNYQMQVSSDLINWTNQGSVFAATNSSMIYPQYFDVNNFNSLYFRLQVAP